MKMEIRKKGYMFVCDGSNGAGKSTVMKAIEAHLIDKGHTLEITREPGGTVISERIRDVLLSPDTPEMCDVTELMLFAAARAQHVRERIIPAIDAGKIVISDRFDSATISFQHYGRGLPIDLINQLNTIATGGFKPDLTIVLDLDPVVGLERIRLRDSGKLDRMEMENLIFLRNARNGYLEQAKLDPEHFAVVDASQSLETVIRTVLDVIDLKI
jgi:dTMP kinase